MFLEIKKRIFFFPSGNQELLNESQRIIQRIAPMLLRTLPNRNLWKFSFLSCLKQTFNQINIYLSLVSLEVPFKSSKNEIRWFLFPWLASQMLSEPFKISSPRLRMWPWSERRTWKMVMEPYHSCSSKAYMLPRMAVTPSQHKVRTRLWNKLVISGIPLST